MLWDVESSLGSCGGDEKAIHWVLVEWMWRKVVRRVEAVAAAVLLQSGGTAVAGRIAGWGRRPPTRIVAADDSDEGLAAVGDRIRHAAGTVRPVSTDDLVRLMEQCIGDFNPLWSPLESEAVRDRMLAEERTRQERAREAAERQQKRDDEKEQKQRQRQAAQRILLSGVEGEESEGPPAKRPRPRRHRKRTLSTEEPTPLLEGPQEAEPVEEPPSASAHPEKDYDKEGRRVARQRRREEEAKRQ